MKLNTLVTIAALIFATFSISTAQDINYQSIAVLSIDAQGLPLNSNQVGNITRNELLKLDLYQVIDRHENEYVMEKNNIDPNKCYNRACLIEVGKKLNAGKVLTGSVEALNDKILVNFRLIDVQKETEINSEVMEYLNLPDQIDAMIEVTIQKMFNKKVDTELVNNLTNEDGYENSINVGHTDNLKMNGPRLGFIYFTGDAAKLMEAPVEKGGFGLSPYMFQFGYQFEVQYLSTGEIQALFEFLPLISGLDQGLFIPSVTLLNGLRSSKHGFEFAFGPTFSISDINQEHEPQIKAGFVFGIGKTFNSGRLNFPINAFFIPGKSGNRFGISVGFNMVSYEDRQ